MNVSDCHFLNRSEYFTHLTQAIRRTKPGERALVASMSFEPSEPSVGGVVRELTAAARRGVDTYLAIDAYNFLAGAQPSLAGPLWTHATLPERLPEPYASRRHALELLTEAGAHCAITNLPNRPFTVIPAGRSHIKTAVVGDRVYIGGCNLHIPEELDVMMTWRDAKTADWLFDTMQQIVVQQSTKRALRGVDRGFAVDANNTLLLDAGTPRQSLILDEAHTLIDSAEQSIFLTCQYFPGAATAQHLKAARARGVDVTIVYSHPSAHGQLKAPAHHAYGLKERLRLPRDFFTHRLPKSAPLLHAKVLVTDQGAMVGSHNYVVQGVNFGTAELALLSHDPAFGQRLHDCVIRQLPLAPQPDHLHR